ncbi:MAG: glucose-6-phosphate isomerase, partial [Gemmataceae bacterium]
MQLPDESISYEYQAALIPASEEWTPTAELRWRHFLNPARVRDLGGRLIQIRSQVAAERDLQQVPPEMQPLDAAFMDFPQKLLDQQRRKNEESILGRL